FYSLVPHRHLHSFPTRRSSDLATGCAAASRTRCPTRRSSLCTSPTSSTRTRPSPRSPRMRLEAPAVRIVDVETCDFGMMSAYDRSEEHTSELQSRSDLVCRLLL